MPEAIRMHLSDAKAFDDPRAAAQRADELWQAQTQADKELHKVSMSVAKAQEIPKRSTPSTHVSDFCYFHKRYGSKAFRCQAPCTFKGNDNTGRQ